MNTYDLADATADLRAEQRTAHTGNLWRCACTFAAADRCIGETTFVEPKDDGSCGCSCHAEYSDDPENWHPLAMSTTYTKEEADATTDWLERLDAAEALTQEPT